MIDNLRQRFADITSDPYTYIKKNVNSSGKKAIGYLCSYTPIELIHAAEMLPIRIWTTEGHSPKVNAHLQTYCCHVVKSTLSCLLDDKLSFLHGTLFSHSCDSQQCLADIWEINAKFPFHDTFNMPTHLDNASSFAYTVAELNRIKERLEAISGVTITPDNLKHSCRLFNESRQMMRQLAQTRLEFPGIFNLYDIIFTSTIMPVEEHIALMKSFVEAMTVTAAPLPNRQRLFLVGATFDDPAFLRLLEEANGTIVDDDLCIGRRTIDRSIELEAEIDPLAALANSFLQRPLCPSKHRPGFDRGDYLIQRIKQSGASAVIFYLYKFCEPHFFDHPSIKKRLDAENIPSLLLEIEKPGYNIGQIKSRLQAFMEMLAERKKNHFKNAI